MSYALSAFGSDPLFFIYLRRTPKGYSELPAAGVVLNLLGISILTFVAIVVYLMTESQFKRRPLPEEQALQLQTDETTSLNWMLVCELIEANIHSKQNMCLT